VVISNEAYCRHCGEYIPCPKPGDNHWHWRWSRGVNYKSGGTWRCKVVEQKARDTLKEIKKQTVDTNESLVKAKIDEQLINSFTGIESLFLLTSKKSPVLQFDLSGVLVNTWSSITKAAKTLDVNRGGIIGSAAGKIYHFHNYLWRYLFNTKDLLAQDYTGLKFNGWTIIKNPFKKHNHYYVKVQCLLCSRDRELTLSKFIKGQVCPHTRGRQRSTPDKSVLGKTFGSLVPISYSGYKKGYHVWLCKCKCGSTQVVRESQLKDGSKIRCKSCFTFEFEQEAKTHIGKKVGRLTIVGVKHKVFNNGKQGYHMLSKCDCGSNKLVETTYAALTSGHTLSCGCLMRETSSVNGTKNISGAGFKHDWYLIETGERKRCKSGLEALYGGLAKL